MSQSTNEVVRVNAKKLAENALVDTNGKLIGLWFPRREQTTDTNVLTGVLALHQMEGRAVDQADRDACRQGRCEVTAHNGGYALWFPSASKGVSSEPECGDTTRKWWMSWTNPRLWGTIGAGAGAIFGLGLMMNFGRESDIGVWSVSGMVLGIIVGVGAATMARGWIRARTDAVRTPSADAHSEKGFAQDLKVELVNYFGGERVNTSMINSPEPIVLTHAREAPMIMQSLRCQDCHGRVADNSLSLEGNILPYEATCTRCGKKRTMHFSIPLFR